MPASKMIKTLFGEEEISIVSDSDEFLNKCSELGFKTLNIHNISELPKNTIIFSFSNDAAKLTFSVAKNTFTKKSVFCATQVFEPTVSAALYGLKLLMGSDIEDALSAQKHVLQMLNSDNLFVLSGNGADAQVMLADNARPYALLSEDLQHDFVQSVAELFEVHFAHMKPQDPCPFSFNGTLRISGILTVLRKPNTALPDGLKESLNWLSDRISKKGACLSVKNNIITSFRIDDEEHIKLLDLAAGRRGLRLTEFAVGVNEAIMTNIDYSINSQMNEGISGVHLAIGDGSSGYHIDFLSPTVKVKPLTSSTNFRKAADPAFHGRV